MMESDTKWIEQEDILDRYALGRLTPEERSRLDQLLNADEALRRQLEFTLMTAGAVRQLGREELKERLRKRIAESGTPAMSITHSTEPKPILLRGGLVLKAAAVITAVAGISYLVYRLYFHVPDVEPVVRETPPARLEDEKPPAPAREEKMMTHREDSIKPPVAKKSTGKGTTTTRPLTLATPTESIKTKHAQKFKAEAFLLPKTNEVRLTVVSEDRSEIESKLLFKNPVDLSAVDIHQTHDEKDGTLHWFYVHFDNQVLSVYLDNSKYLGYFKAPRLELSASRLVLQTNGQTYDIDLTSKDKFRKAVLRP